MTPLLFVYCAGDFVPNTLNVPKILSLTSQAIRHCTSGFGGKGFLVFHLNELSGTILARLFQKHKNLSEETNKQWTVYLVKTGDNKENFLR